MLAVFVSLVKGIMKSLSRDVLLVAILALNSKYLESHCQVLSREEERLFHSRRDELGVRDGSRAAGVNRVEHGL